MLGRGFSGFVQCYLTDLANLAPWTGQLPQPDLSFVIRTAHHSAPQDGQGSGFHADGGCGVIARDWRDATVFTITPVSSIRICPSSTIADGAPARARGQQTQQPSVSSKPVCPSNPNLDVSSLWAARAMRLTLFNKRDMFFYPQFMFEVNSRR